MRPLLPDCYYCIVLATLSCAISSQGRRFLSNRRRYYSRIPQCRCSYTLNIPQARGVRGVHGVTGISGCVYMDQVESQCSPLIRHSKTTAATSLATATPPSNNGADPRVAVSY